MKKQADITFVNNQFSLKGDIDYFNVLSLYRKSLKPLRKCPEFIFDFSAVNSSDSAGLALIVEWIRLAKEWNKKVRFQSLSEDIHALAKASGLDELIVGKV